MDGVSVSQVKPGLIKDCREFIDKYSDVENFSVYGYDDWANQYIGKYFDKCDEYDADERLLICYYRTKNIKELHLFKYAELLF